MEANLFASPALPNANKSQVMKPAPKTPEECIALLESSPMVEMTRRKPKWAEDNGPIPINLDGDTTRKGHMSATKTRAEATENEHHDVKYFREILTSETNRLKSLHDQWEQTLTTDSISISGEDHGDICAVIGAAQLLMDQRFNQFSQLIDDCEFKRGEKETLPSDLQGFWDMIYYQVEDVDKKFAGLEKLKANNWVRKSPEKKLVKKKKIVSKKVAKSTKSDFAAFRAKMKKEAEEKLFDGVFFQIQSPTKPLQKDSTDDSETSMVNNSECLSNEDKPTAINAADKENSILPNCDTRNDSSVQFKEPPVAIVTPKRRYVPIVPSPLLHDITPKDSGPRSGRGRLSLTVPFSGLTVKETRRSTRCTPVVGTPLKSVLEDTEEITADLDPPAPAAAMSTPVNVDQKCYPKTPLPTGDGVEKEGGDYNDGELRSDTHSRKRSSSGDLMPPTSGVKRRRKMKEVDENQDDRRVTRSSAKDLRRRGSGRRPQRRSARS